MSYFVVVEDRKDVNKNKKPRVQPWVTDVLSEIRESNPPHRLGKPVHYRCANLAKENTNSFHKKEPRAGLEPATHALRMRCSTN